MIVINLYPSRKRNNNGEIGNYNGESERPAGDFSALLCSALLLLLLCFCFCLRSARSGAGQAEDRIHWKELFDDERSEHMGYIREPTL